ncbi:MAG: YbaK/EbsC family protein [Actinomycetota bacterium]
MKRPTREDPKLQRVIDAGTERGLDVRPVLFEEETRTAADAARAIGCEVAQIVKSLVFEDGTGPLLFLVSGANRVDLDRAAAVAGVDRLAKADATAARASTGFSIGATPPFGHLTQLDVYMDEDLLDWSEVWAAAGRVDAIFSVEPHALKKATGATVATLRQD